MEVSPRLSLSYVMPQQAQKHVTVNESFRRLDTLVGLAVKSDTLAPEPSSPAEGDAYILPVNPSGDSWAGFTAQSIAAFQGGAWMEITPSEGVRAYVIDASALKVFDGAGWTIVSSGAGGDETSARYGVNTTADNTNRLAVKSDAVLFNYDDVTPGNDDCQVKINKKTAADTGSLLFQTNASGRAEIGLTGGDNLQVNVSVDGATWTNAIFIDGNTGRQSLLHSGAPLAPLDINAGAVGSETINGRAINMAAIYASTTSGRTGFLFSNNNNYLPSGSSSNSVFQFHYPHDSGGTSTYKVFRIAKGAILSDTFWVNVDGGAVFGAPTGGDKGAGAINAQAVYDDNALLSCYVFDQVLDGVVDIEKWDKKVPDRKKNSAGDGVDELVKKRRHIPARLFSARIASQYNPLSLDGYARHWKEKRHLTSMPNEASFDAEKGMPSGAWIQRLIETVEIQAVLIEQLNQRLKIVENAQ